MSFDTLLASLEQDATPPNVELSSLHALRGDERERFLDVWRRLSIQQRRTIIDRLSDIGEDNVEMDFSAIFLVGLLDDDVQVRADSIRALWEYEGGDLPPLLERLLHDREALVRGEAALGMGRFLLRAELDGHENPALAAAERQLGAMAADEAELVEVRGRAIEALGVRSTPAVRQLIEESYETHDRRLQISAVHAMGRNADSSWLPIIFEEMGSEDPEMRFEAATAAGGIADEQAIPYLAELTGDEDAEVQEAAIGALGQIGGPQARAVLHGVAAETSDTRLLEAISDALSEADFVEDPMGIKLYMDQSVAADAEDEDDE